MNEIVMIDAARLRPHPDNPRQDLGDLEELTESIRASGVLQNLTVVVQNSDVYGIPETYRIVIGHRRYAAAVRAGLTELPCVISDMGPEEQLATMMAENVQRNNLTLYEQIQGVGRMVQLGMDLPEIAKKTGISEKTVRRDAKICSSFRPKTLKKASDDGITIQDLVELQEIEDEKVREEVLSKYGSGWTFANAKNSAIYNQKSKKFKDAFLKKIEGLGIHQLKKPNDRWGGAWDRIRGANGMDGLKRMEPFTPDEGAEYAWYCDGMTAEILRKNKDWDDKLNADKAEKKIMKKKAEEVDRLNQECRELREAFVRGLKPSGNAKGNEDDRACRLLFQAIFNKTWTDFRWGNTFKLTSVVRMLLDTEDLNPLAPNEANNTLEAFRNRKIPDCRMAVAAALAFDSWNGNLIRLDHGRFVQVPTPEYAMTYGILLEFGYEISDLEQSLMDGSHPIFREDE